MDWQEKIVQARQFIESRSHGRPEVGLILGSGLGAVASRIEKPTVIDYGEIPEFPVSTVSGHSGKLVLGNLNGRSAAVMQGRVHYYEGYSIDEVTFPVRVLGALGVKYLIITSAVGAINLNFHPGMLIFLKDFINFMGVNPLRGKHFAEFGERFPDMSEVYDKKLRQIALKVARRQKIKSAEGIYLAASGPSYETPAEIRAFRRLGADVVGMSMVPESIVANQMGMKILGITYISNYAAGLTTKKLSHQEVMDIGKKVSERLSGFILSFLSELNYARL